MVISIETHITCDFLGGGGVRTPYPALDPHMTGWQLGLHWLSPQKKTGPTECSFGYTSILAMIRVIYLSCFGALFVKVTLFCS